MQEMAATAARRRGIVSYDAATDVLTLTAWVVSHLENEMRKVLLASAALLGGTVSLAYAQAPTVAVAPAPSQGQLVAPYGASGSTNTNNNAWGIANTPTGSAAAGPLSTIRAPYVYATPVPGTLVIRLNGRVEADVAANFTSVDVGRNANGAPNGYKLNPVGVATDIRLYFGADGMAANGLRYGGAIELWQNFYGGTAESAATTASVSGSGYASAQTVYVRKAFTYLASDQAGVLRVGGADGIIGLMDPCIFSSQCWDAGMGTLNGGASTAISPQGAFGIPWVFASQAGAEYATQKIVYLSPQFSGFDLGVNYVPSRDGNAFGTAPGPARYRLACAIRPARSASPSHRATTRPDGSTWSALRCVLSIRLARSTSRRTVSMRPRAGRS
jgi:hypothetical protein